MNVLVTGSKGQLGQTFKHVFSDYPEFEGNYFYVDRKELDITDFELVKKYFQENQIGICFNCAAYTNVDGAEDQQNPCRAVNVEGVANLAKACMQNQAILVHYSTDYVFNGQNYKPYTEEDTTSPINYYGLTKLEGEQKALELNSKTIIIRTSWVYSPFAKNFVKTIADLAKKRQELTIISDQIGTPTFTFDLVRSSLDLSKKNFFGIYNFSNQGVCSWYDFAREIVQILGLKTEVLPITTDQYPTKAKRPFYSILSKQKITKVLDLQIPHWQDSLKQMLDSDSFNH